MLHVVEQEGERRTGQRFGEDLAAGPVARSFDAELCHDLRKEHLRVVECCAIHEGEIAGG